MTEHIELEPRMVEGGGYGGYARWLNRCSCGWEQQRNGAPRSNTFAAHRDAALKPDENRCRYCAAAVDGWGRLHCSDGCARADLVRAQADAKAAALDAHRVGEVEGSPVAVHPDQLEMFGGGT